jgi:hypothetical protein
MSIARLSLLTFFTLTLLVAPGRLGAQTRPPAAPSLVGTWVLTAADDLRPDGTRAPAYGADPQGGSRSMPRAATPCRSFVAAG